MASSLIWATKKLSTMLYRELTSIESTMGSAIERISGSTGFSFIKFSFIFALLTVLRRISRHRKSHTTAQADGCVAKRRQNPEKSTQKFSVVIIKPIALPVKRRAPVFKSEGTAQEAAPLSACAARLMRR